MINNHPLCPKSAMEKYYLDQKLPSYQTVPRQEPQKKNHDYYHDNTNIWNNAHQASSNMKVFGKIKMQNDQGEKRIEKLQKLQQQDKQLMEMHRKVYLNQAHEEDLLRLQNRKLERAGLQNLSSQVNDLNCESTLLRGTISTAPLLGRPEFLWNKVSQQSQKQVNLLINAKILGMEEEAIRIIGERITKEEQVEQMREDLRLENMNKIRIMNQKRKQENIELQQRAGISPIRRNLIQRVMTAKSNNLIFKESRNNDIVEQTLNGMQNNLPLQFTSRPYTVGSQEQQSLSFNNGMRPQTSQFEHRFQNSTSSKNQLRTDKLSQPKKNLSQSVQNKNPLDRSEYKGLYLTHAVDVHESTFGRTMKQSSQILRENLTYQSRMSQKSMRPKKIINHQKEIQNEDQRKQVETAEMLDSFERKLHRKQQHYDD